MKAMITNMIGWYGVLAILGAYALLSFSFAASNSLTYQLLNLTGALAIVYETAHKKDYQPVVLNIAWSLVAAIAILRIIVAS